MYITTARNPLRDAQSEAPAAFCEDCQGEVYSGEHLYLWESKRICSDCLARKVNRMLRESPVLLAEELGVGTISV